MLTVPEVTDGGVHIVDDMREARGMASPQGVVLALGRSAFQDKSRFAIDGELVPCWRLVIGDLEEVRCYDLSDRERAAPGFMNDTQAVATIDAAGPCRFNKESTHGRRRRLLWRRRG